MANALLDYCKHFDISNLCVWNHNFSSAKTMASHYSVSFIEELDKIIQESDLIAIAVKDDAIQPIVQKISAFDIKNKVFLHFSGCMGTEVFASLIAKGAHCAIVHPLMTITQNFEKNPLFSAPCGVYATNEELCKIIDEWLKKAGQNSFRLGKSIMPLYHAAAVISCAGLIELLSSATELIATQLQINNQEAKKLLTPIIYETINQFESSDEIQKTGPWIRKDVQTIELHRNAIQNHSPLILAIYDALMQKSKEGNNI